MPTLIDVSLEYNDEEKSQISQMRDWILEKPYMGYIEPDVADVYGSFEMAEPFLKNYLKRRSIPFEWSVNRRTLEQRIMPINIYVFGDVGNHIDDLTTVDYGVLLFPLVGGGELKHISMETGKFTKTSFTPQHNCGYFMDDKRTHSFKQHSDECMGRTYAIIFDIQKKYFVTA